MGYLRQLGNSKIKDYRDIYVTECIESYRNDWFPVYQEFVQKDLKHKNKDILGETIPKKLSSQTSQTLQIPPSPSSDIPQSLLTLKTLLTQKITNLQAEMNSKISSLKSILEQIPTKTDVSNT